MASIVKRKKKYSVVYTYTDENGNKRQKWETFETNSEAKKRKLQVEYEQESGTFIPPSAKTVNDLLDEYMLTLPRYLHHRWTYIHRADRSGSLP